MSLSKTISIFFFILLISVCFWFFLSTPTEKKTDALTSPLLPVELQLEPQTKFISEEPTHIEILEKEAIEEPLDRIEEFFNTSDQKFPIVETITYTSRVPWLKGRPAWLSDYSSHYSTSRHFIARSLNGKPDYFSQEVKEGDKFNVLKLDQNICFCLVIDASQCKMRFYYIDGSTKEAILVKTYNVGLGRFDSTKSSGLLTPLGIFSLGNKVTIFRPKTTDIYQGEKTEMIRIFGTRWIPFQKIVGNSKEPADGIGLHGVPWISGREGKLEENISSIGKYESDGCVRLSTSDIEELYAIIISRPTIVEIVKTFTESKILTKNGSKYFLGADVNKGGS